MTDRDPVTTSPRSIASTWASASTVGDVLLRAAAERPDQIALAMPDERWTYRDLADRARAVARALIGSGVRIGDHVGLLMQNGSDCVSALFGIALSGAVVVPINARFRARELRYVVENADLAAVLTTSRRGAYTDFAALLSAALPGLADADDPRALRLEAAPRLRMVVALGDQLAPGTLGDDAFLAVGDAVSDDELETRRAGVRIRATGVILYTSGTTSAPRGCLVSHEAIVRNWTAVLDRLGLTPDDRVWNPGPFFHIAGIGVLVATLQRGATVITDSHFDAERALRQLETERASILYPAFGTLTLGLMALPRFPDADLSAARVMLNVGLPETLRQIQDAFPGLVNVSTFGMTECCGITTLQDPSDPLEVRLDTVGSPLPGVEVAVVDPETGERLGPDRPGELLVRGWNLADGYLKAPEKTAEAFDAEGWLHTGDRVELRADGNMTYSGRLRDMVRVGGENVSPAEVEEYLCTHPAVRMAQVVGVPDARLDEVPAAYVELHAGTTVGEAELIDFCRGQIAGYKVPRHVRVVTEWPMSATKIRKDVLRERLAEELAAATS